MIIMNKSLYSLMLMDEVVSEIDKLALRQGTNRSNLVNQILAEYVSVSTPEKQIDSIFRRMEELLDRSSELVPLVTPNQLSMSVKSLEEKLGYQLFVNLDEVLGKEKAAAVKTENPKDNSWWWE